ncbi:Acs Acyl-coenzyme A synthetases/AMP-(fatty) acid ligases [actinobacterium SCGC AAA044-D11]
MAKSAHIDTFAKDNLPDPSLWPELILDHSTARYPERLNASYELLERTIEIVGANKVAVIAADGTYSYGQLLELVNKISNFLKSEGVVAGNRIAIRGPNNAMAAASWLAILRIGAIAVTTIPLQRAAELEKIIDIGQIQFALVDHRFTEEWNLISNFKGRSYVYGGESDFAKKIDSQSPVFEVCDTASDDVSLLAFTSGSTGVPKATMHFHRDILAIADTFSKNIVKPNKDDVFAGSPPIAFTFGLGGLVVFPFRVGATTVLLENAVPPILLEKISEFKITCLFTAPTAYRAMLPLLAGKDISSLRRCISAGEHLPLATWRAWFEATGNKLIDGIGATELLHIFISASDHEIIPGLTGKPVPGYLAMVVDQDFNEVKDGEHGFLAVKGPTGCRYLNDPRQSDYAVNGWNITGDIYTRTAEGYFKYESRADDMIISSGYNIAAPEVENTLLMHKGVAEVAVVGLPDEERGMIVTAYVVLRPEFLGSDAMVKELQDHVKSQIAPYKYPRSIHFVDSLPKTTTGKLQRFRLKS